MLAVRPKHYQRKPTSRDRKTSTAPRSAMRRGSPKEGPLMDPKPLVQLASGLRPGNRLEWIKHLNKHPDDVVKIVAIQSGAFVLTVIVGMLIWAFRG